MPKFSPFFTFVHFYRNEERKNGRRLTLDEAKIQAGPIWADMADCHKVQFVTMAEDQTFEAKKRLLHPRGGPRSDPRALFHDKMRTFMESFLSRIQDVRTHQFFFMALHQETHTRSPSEITVVRFNITGGADHFLHFLLNPECSPEMYTSYSQAMSEPITVIPVEGTMNSKQNLLEVLDAIFQFCGGPVFTSSSSIEPTLQCLGKLQKDCPNRDREVVPLDGEQLIHMLWERSTDGHNAKLVTVRNKCSSMAGLDYLACHFHKACNRASICTLWKPYCLAYVLSQLLAKPYGVRLAEGFHKSNRNWVPMGTYYAGRGQYENWKFESGWESGATSSGASRAGDSKWAESHDKAWCL